LIETFRTEKVNLSNALELGRLIAYQDNEVTIEYKKVHSFHENWIRKNQHLLEEAFKQHFKKTIKLKINTIDTGEINAEDDQQVLKKVSAEDPIINTLIDELGLELK
jgi:hypothetical protein